MDGMATDGRPHRFTVADFYRISEAGVFASNPRVELIRGEIIDMAAIGTPHSAMVNRLNRLLVLAIGARGIVSVQNPLRLDASSEPQPDVAVLKPRADEYETGHPAGEDALLVIEVADTSLAYDQTVKAPLYAGGGIAEYWIVNLRDRTVEIHRQPVDGRYAQVRTVGTGDVLDAVLLPGLALSAAEVLRRSDGWP